MDIKSTGKKGLHFYLALSIFIMSGFISPISLHAEEYRSGIQDTIAETEARTFAEWKWNNADINSVFAQFSAVSGIDIVSAPEIQGKVTVHLRNKSWQEAFNIVCKVYDIIAIREDEYIYVQNRDDYLANRQKTAQSNQGIEEFLPLERKIIRIYNMNAEALKTPVSDLLSEKGKITVIKHNNSLIIYDTKGNINQIETLINKLDKEARQISISAKIIEVTSGTVNNIGVNWSAMGPLGPERNGENVGYGGVTHSPVIKDALEQVFYGIIGQDEFSVALDMLFSEENAEIVAQPQIITLENEEAIISTGSQVPVLYTDEGGNTKVEMIDASTQLKVTPQISASGRVILDLNPKKKSYTPTDQGAPIINEQSAETKVIVNDGETVVIAGLTENRKSNNEAGIPVLKDIPLIGNLFKKSEKEIAKKDLIIFVTPHIIKDGFETDKETAGEEPEK